MSHEHLRNDCLWVGRIGVSLLDCLLLFEDLESVSCRQVMKAQKNQMLKEIHGKKTNKNLLCTFRRFSFLLLASGRGKIRLMKSWAL